MSLESDLWLHRAAQCVIGRYARLHGVKLMRVGKRTFFDKVEYTHPKYGADIGFNRGTKTVYMVEDFDNVMQNRNRLRFLVPHEITHCIWPEIDHARVMARHVDGPEEEWACGMISYELAWLGRLATSKKAKKCMAHWTDYALEGAPTWDDDAVQAATRRVAEYGLPDPWSA